MGGCCTKSQADVVQAAPKRGSFVSARDDNPPIPVEKREPKRTDVVKDPVAAPVEESHSQDTVERPPSPPPREEISATEHSEAEEAMSEIFSPAENTKESLEHTETLLSANEAAPPATHQERPQLYAVDYDVYSSSDAESMHSTLALNDEMPSTPEGVGVRPSVVCDEFDLNPTLVDGSMVVVDEHPHMPETLLSPPRNHLLQRQKFLLLELDEVSSRDAIAREGTALIESAVRQCFSIHHCHTRRQYVWPAIMASHTELLLAGVVLMEERLRLDMERTRIQQCLTIFAEGLKNVHRKRVWEHEQKKMAERNQLVLHRKRLAREDAKRTHRLAWEVDRQRIAADKGMEVRDQLFADFQELPPADTIRESAIPGRLTCVKRAALERLVEEESRHREAVVDEARKRRDALLDEIGAACPWLLSHTTNALAVRCRNEAEAAHWSLVAKGLVLRVSEQVESSCERKNSERRDIAKASALFFDETSVREAIQRQYLHETLRLEKNVQLLLETATAQECRRDRKRKEMKRREMQPHIEEKARLLLNRAGRGFIWRARLGIVFPQRDLVRSLVKSESRERKAVTLEENIASGDIVQFYVLQAKLTMDSPQRCYRCDISTVPWDPSTCAPVESLSRDILWREFTASFEEVIVRPSSYERTLISRLPPHMIGARVRGAVALQRLFRRFRLRDQFQRTQRDALVLGRMSRLAIRTEIRLLREQELASRFTIEEEALLCTPLKRGVFPLLIEDWRRQRRAAERIQALFRGYAWRTKALDPLLLDFFKRRLEAIRSRHAGKLCIM